MSSNVSVPLFTQCQWGKKLKEITRKLFTDFPRQNPIPLLMLCVAHIQYSILIKDYILYCTVLQVQYTGVIELVLYSVQYVVLYTVSKKK